MSFLWAEERDVVPVAHLDREGDARDLAASQPAIVVPESIEIERPSRVQEPAEEEGEFHCAAPWYGTIAPFLASSSSSSKSACHCVATPSQEKFLRAYSIKATRL